MKKFLILLMLLGLTSIYAQDFDQNMPGPPREKIEELERLKLLEILNMDEETSVRFFTRQNQNKAEIQKIIDRKEAIVDEMENAIKNNDKNYNYQAKIDELSKIEKDLVATREKFFNSLGDILTTEQIAKVLVFENRFFREIRNTLIRRGRGRN